MASKGFGHAAIVTTGEEAMEASVPAVTLVFTEKVVAPPLDGVFKFPIAILPESVFVIAAPVMVMTYGVPPEPSPETDGVALVNPGPVSVKVGVFVQVHVEGIVTLTPSSVFAPSPLITSDSATAVADAACVVGEIFAVPVPSAERPTSVPVRGAIL